MVFKFITNRWTILFLIIGICIFYQSAAIAEPCHRNADNKIVLDDTSGNPVSHDAGSTYDKDYCNEEPLFYQG